MSIKTLFQDIADAIKVKDTSIVSLTPSQMPNAIINIPSGSAIDLTKISLVGLYCVARRGGGGGYCQVSNLRLVDSNNNIFQFPSDRIASEWGGYSTGSGEFAYNIFDNSVNTKGILNTIPNSAHPFGWLCYLPNNTIDCTTYNKWQWYTANDAQDRDPISFGLLLGSGDILDNMIINCFDFQTNYNVTTNRRALAYDGIITI